MSARHELYHANQSSAHLLAKYADQRFTERKDDPRRLLIWDLYIKARSYALLNKAAFVGALIFGGAVLLWPGIAVIVDELHGDDTVWSSPVLQTTVTALAAATFALYSHYKGRQLEVENMMRRVVLAPELSEALLAGLLRDLERIDTGFAFQDAILHKPSGDAHEQGDAQAAGGTPKPPTAGADPRPEPAPQAGAASRGSAHDGPDTSPR